MKDSKKKKGQGTDDTSTHSFDDIKQGRTSGSAYFSADIDDKDSKSPLVISAAQSENNPKDKAEKHGQQDRMGVGRVTIEGDPAVWMKDRMQEMVKANTPPPPQKKGFFSAFKKQEEPPASYKSGSTGAICNIDPLNGEIDVTSIGDSRIYLTIEDKTKQPPHNCFTVLLTEDMVPKEVLSKNQPKHGKAKTEDGRIAKHIKDHGGFVTSDQRVVLSNAEKIAYNKAKREHPNETPPFLSSGMGGSIGDGQFGNRMLRHPDQAKFKIPGLIDEIAKQTGISTNPADLTLTASIMSDGAYEGRGLKFHDFEVNYHQNADDKGTKQEYTINHNKYVKKDEASVLSTLVANHGDKPNLSEHLKSEALLHGSQDDVSIITLGFSAALIGSEAASKEKGVCLFMFDGHGGEKVAQGCKEHMERNIEAERAKDVQPTKRPETETPARKPSGETKDVTPAGLPQAGTPRSSQSAGHPPSGDPSPITSVTSMKPTQERDQNQH